MTPVALDVSAFLFDMDGVLVSSIGSVRRSWRRWGAHYGVPNADQIEIPHGTRAIDIITLLKPDIDDKWAGLRLIEDMEIEDVDDLKVLAGVPELLATLPLDRWAIVTSATDRLLRGRLAAAGLPLPGRIISGDIVENGKPHPEPYLRGAALVNALPGECLVVEDAPSGIHAGVAAGCRVMGVLGTHTAEELREAGAEWVVASLEHVTASTTAQGLHVQLDTV